MTHVIFDLDNTLIDTSRLMPYMATNEGRRYVAANPMAVPTELCHESLPKLVRLYQKHGSRVSIVTNSPEDYAAALIRKHGFPSDIPIFAAAKKPLPGSVESAIALARVPKEETVMIGDGATDMLAAHGAGIASIAVTWGYSTEEQLEKSEPADIVKKPSRLEEALELFSEGKIEFSRRTDPNDYDFLPESEFLAADPKFSYWHISDYYPTSDSDFKNLPYEIRQFSRSLLTYKETRNITREELNRGLERRFFHNGELKLDTAYKNVFWWALRNVRSKFACSGIEGRTLFVALPNSNPEYCYKMDVNQILVRNAVKELSACDSPEERVICRVHPKGSSHIGGGRSQASHYMTIGFHDFNFRNVDNVVLFDDITTSGSQLVSAAKIIRYMGFRGKFHGLVIGKTRDLM